MQFMPRGPIPRTRTKSSSAHRGPMKSALQPDGEALFAVSASFRSTAASASLSICYGARWMQMLLPQRRERRRQINVSLLRDQMPWTAGRRPNAVGDGLLAQPRSLVRCFVRPDMHEADRRTGHRDHRRQHGGHARACWNGFAPKLNRRLQSVGLEDIAADLIAGSKRPWPQRRHEI